MFKGIFYSIKQAFKQIFRSKGMSLASVFAITAMMLILALFLALSVNVNYLTENIKDQFGTIEVFLLDETSEEDALKLIESVKGMNGVSDAVYITKAMAMEEFKVRWGENGYLLDGLVDNPLPNSIRITLSDLTAGDIIATAMSAQDGVEDVRFYREEITRVIRIATVLQRGALVVIIFLIIVSVVVVSNTVKLTVMARQEEIKNMTYIGATNWFIRGPMFCEGILIGFFSAAIATGLADLIYTRLCAELGSQAAMLFSTTLVDPKFLIINMAWVFAALGISIGACGSIISMRRYLST